MTYRERREARAERLALWADKRAAKSDAELARAHQMADAIPFGQPILVGHHSERADRNYRDRIHSTMVRGIEDGRKAAEMASRAATIESQLDESIYSDDVDAIERLTERIAALEAKREQDKAKNAEFRKAHKAELAALSPYQRNQAMPFPSYHFENLSGNISKQRQRLDMLKREAAKPKPEAGSVIVRPSNWPGYVEVAFADKPSRDVIDALKERGFRWNKLGSAWVGTDKTFADGLVIARENGTI